MSMHSIHLRSRESGFGLIELMIAMVLGLLVLGAAIAVFQSNQRTFSANEGQNRIQEGARVAYELMSKDIRAAGGSACSNLARPDVEHALTTDETAFLVNPIAGSGTEFTVTSGDDSSYQVDSASVSTVVLTAGQVTKVSDAFKVGDKLVVCNANHLYVVTATAVADATRTITFSPATPLTITADPMAPPNTVAVARYRRTRWYLDNGALSVQRDGAAGQQVITGVTGLNVSYLQTGGNSYSATPTQWTNVVAVRVNLTLRGQKTTGGDVKVDGTNFITRSSTNIASLRSRTL
jgi:type IV pilus assembly protein PilW